MLKHAIWLVLLVAIPAFHSLNIAKHPPTSQKNPVNKYSNFQQQKLETDSVTCGGSLTTFDGRIEYKQFESVGKNERCVWVIQPVNFTSASVSLLSGNTAPQSGSLLVTGIATYGNSSGIIFQSITPTTSSTAISATMLVVTFTTTATPSGSGFTLVYSFRDGNGVRASPNSLNVQAASDLGYIRHPALQTAVYPVHDLSVFIFFPSETCSLPEKIKIRFNEFRLESCCDSLALYEFQRPSWTFRGRIVGGAESQLITSQDMLMIVFSSDDSAQFGGFELIYSIC